MLTKQPLPFLTASAFGDRFEATGELDGRAGLKAGLLWRNGCRLFALAKSESGIRNQI
jgi:hypothetical protein